MNVKLLLANDGGPCMGMANLLGTVTSENNSLRLLDTTGAMMKLRGISSKRVDLIMNVEMVNGMETSSLFYLGLRPH